MGPNVIHIALLTTRFRTKIARITHCNQYARMSHSLPGEVELFHCWKQRCHLCDLLLAKSKSAVVTSECEKWRAVGVIKQVAARTLSVLRGDRAQPHRDITDNLLSEVCNDVCIEPDLQPVNGEQLAGNVEDGTRLDIAANGFWGGRFECTYIDARVFNPHPPSNRH